MNFSCLSNQFKKEECRSLDNIFFFTTIILCVVIICLCIVCLCINCCCCYCLSWIIGPELAKSTKTYLDNSN